MRKEGEQPPKIRIDQKILVENFRSAFDRTKSYKGNLFVQRICFQKILKNSFDVILFGILSSPCHYGRHASIWPLLSHLDKSIWTHANLDASISTCFYMNVIHKHGGGGKMAPTSYSFAVFFRSYFYSIKKSIF